MDAPHEGWRQAVEAARGGAVYRALADAIAADIAAGRLAPGAALPPQRRLAWGLGVAIATVTRAYDELSARGLVTAEVDHTRRTLSACATNFLRYAPLSD